MGLGGNSLTRFAGSREGALATAAGFVGGFSMAAKGVLSALTVSDSQPVREMYEAVTGVGPERARADLAFVSERLAPFLTVSALSKYPNESVRKAALILLVAAADADQRMAPEIAAAWEQWRLFLDRRDERDGRKANLLNAAKAYAAAWEPMLAS